MALCKNWYRETEASMLTQRNQATRTCPAKRSIGEYAQPRGGFLDSGDAFIGGGNFF